MNGRPCRKNSNNSFEPKQKPGFSQATSPSLSFSLYKYSLHSSLSQLSLTLSPLLSLCNRVSSLTKMFTFKEMPQSASSLFSAYASFATSMMLIRSVTHELLPPQLTSFLSSIFFYFFGSLNSQTTLIIDENCGYVQNQVFEAAEIYLRTKITPSTDTLKVSKTARQKRVTLSIEKGQEIIDHFDNIRLKWRLICSQDERGGNSREKRHFELIFAKKFRDRVVEYYFPYILGRAKEIKEDDKVVKIFSQECQFDDEYGGGRGGNWGSINLEHPATFATLAMDPELKNFIIEDLDRFVRRKEFYKNVGKAWKRGYLLYGPPGTGKSSLIAAMANYLKFDIYDLDLTNIYSNSDLRRVLLATTNRSILVIEDIDCSVDMQNRQNDENFDRSSGKFTLSGMLNFIDGLWSSCGDERIIIFTTNHKDRLDPALLRPGRMDVHIHMSYCTPHGFKVLASNYLGGEVTNHRLYGKIEQLIETTAVSPAEVAEELMKSDDTDVVLEGLVNFLKRKQEEKSAAKEERTSDKNEEPEEEGDENLEEQTPKRIKQNQRVIRHRRGRGIRFGSRGRGSARVIL